MRTARLTLDGNDYELPVFEGSEGEVAIDISQLRAQSGAITYDPGYGNTGACKSDITFVDGEKGILRYRGYDIADLAAGCQFSAICYLLIWGHLPSAQELARFRDAMRAEALIHEDMKKFFEGYTTAAHPMAILSAMVGSLSAYYPDVVTDDDLDRNIIRLLAKSKTIAAFSYKKSIGQPFVYPRNDLGYASDFLHMMFATPMEPYAVPPAMAEALNMLLILHADHEQNCSTSTVRMVGSSGANLFASTSAGISALWGPLHGGANQAVLKMLEEIHQSGSKPAEFVAKVKDKDSGVRLMGFGHRVYKNFDPRAKIIKEACDKVLNKLGVNDPLLDIARALEAAALSDEYFIERKLYPNVDFYSGIIMRAIGIPTNMFTVMFAIGRIPGWISHWREVQMAENPRIHRPRQIYTGPTQRAYKPIDKRG